jgi:hypothetical protein
MLSSGTHGAAEPGALPVTITIDAGSPGPVVPDDFAGLSFEVGPLRPGNQGVPGYLFSPGNDSLVTLFRNLGLGSLRVGGGSVDKFKPAGIDSDGFTGIDNLFAFAAVAGVKVIYTVRLLNRGAKIGELKSINAWVAGEIWRHYRENVASFAIGNEPDWHSYHVPDQSGLSDRAIFEVPEKPGSAHPPEHGSAYPSYHAQWQSFADAIKAVAPEAPLSGPDTGAYWPKTYYSGPDGRRSWTEQLALDERDSGRIAEVTQHYYVGHEPGDTTAQQAISNMLSPQWVTGTSIVWQSDSPESSPKYTPYPWLHTYNLKRVAEAGLCYRLTESNDYLEGVSDASNVYASALWALDHLHWWAANGAAGVNFHNKQWYKTCTIVPKVEADPGRGYVITPKGYGIKAFTLGSAGRVKPVQIHKPDGFNLTAYCVGRAGEDYVTIINKAHGAGARDAAVTIVAPGPRVKDAEMMTLAGRQPGDARGDKATLGGATITGDTPWDGKWSALPADPRAGISLTVKATTATIIKIHSGG